MLGKRDHNTQSKRDDVDKELAFSEKYEVCDTNGEFNSHYLMKTDLGKNNNKFYVLQMLRDKSSNSYYLWTRYGRVGDIGQKSLKGMSKE